MSRTSKWGVVCALAVLATGCKDGCRRQADKPDPAASLRARLSFMPKGTETLAAMDFAQFRASKHWQRLRAVAGENTADNASIAQLTERTGLDPFEDVDRLLAALPRNARESGAFALLVEGKNFDERRLVAYARDQMKTTGGRLEQKEIGGQRLWMGQGQQEVGGFFVGKRRFFLGGGGWASLCALLVEDAGKAEKQGNKNPESRGAAGRIDLANLAVRLRDGGAPAAWFASLVPADLRPVLLSASEDEAAGSAAASVVRWGVAVFLDQGMRIRMRAELSNAEDATALAQRFEAFIHSAKASPKTLLLGLTSYLEGVRIKPMGPNIDVTLQLNDLQISNLLDRLAAMMATAGSDETPQAAPAPSAP